MHGIWFAAGSLLALWCSRADAQCVVYGTVSDSVSEAAIPSASVWCVGSQVHMSTDSRGRYALQARPGQDTLRVSCVGYRPRALPISLRAADSMRIDLSLVSDTLLLDSVIVSAERMAFTSLPDIGALAVSPREVRNVSGAFGDVFRTLQGMPGATSNNEMSAQINVRGGTAEENLILLNGVEVLEPFHLKESPNTGVGIFNMDLLKRVLFIPGGFTARYGDRLSAVLDLAYREGNRDQFVGTLDASLSDATVIIEGPLGRRITALASARSTYADYVSHYLLNSDQRKPSFYDLQGVVGVDASENHHLTLQVLQSRDRTSGLADGEYGTALASLGSELHLSNVSVLRTSGSLYRQDGNLVHPGVLELSDTMQVDLRDSSNIRLANAGISLETALIPGISFLLGLDFQHYDYDVDQHRASGLPADSLASSALHISSNKIAAYLENRIAFTKQFSANLGGRMDHSALTGETRFSPRFLATYDIDRGITLKAAAGLYFQTPAYQQLLAASRAGLPPQRMQRALHYLLGFEKVLRADLKFRAEAYYKRLDNLIPYERLKDGDLLYGPNNGDRGEIKGLDFEASFSDARVMGWVNFSFMVAKEVTDGDTVGWHYRPTDQNRTLTAVFEYRVADDWVANIRSYYGSGFAFLDNVPGGGYVRNHYPEYKRIDVRLNHTFSHQPLRATAFVEITNLLSNRNVSSFRSGTQANKSPDYNLLLPLILNVGIQLRFQGATP